MSCAARTLSHYLAGLLAGFAAGITIGAARAQETSPERHQLDRATITGTRNQRAEEETALPIVRIKAEELARAGVTNAEGAMQWVTQSQGGLPTAASTSTFTGAAAYANLRALGAQRTLVLLNGRRVVTNPYATVAVDLNTLPFASVQRIDVLTDGASATYGTDAIAGVVNFITRREYEGITVAAEAQIPEAPGYETYTASLLAGWGDLAGRGWNVYGSFNYRKQLPLGGTERDFAQTSYLPARGFDGTSATTFPGNYSQSVDPDGPGPLPPAVTVRNTNPSLPDCAPPTSIPVLSDPTRCFADTQAFVWTIPKQEQWQSYLRGSLALTDDAILFGEYYYASNVVESQIAPSPESGLTMPPASPFYPGNGITPLTHPGLVRTAPIALTWRTTALGTRRAEAQTDTQRAVVGIEGARRGWDYQAALLWSKSDVTQDLLSGYPAAPALRSGVAGSGGAPFLNPFGDQSPQGLAYMQANTIGGRLSQGEGELRSVTATASRSIGSLGAGPVSLALGLEYRTEEALYATDMAKTAQLGSLQTSDVFRQGERDLSAVALEIVVPLLSNLEFGAAARYDHYSDFGSTTNPKFTIRYAPAQSLLLRASYNTGFTAPTLTQLHAPQVAAFTPRFNDPTLCPGGQPVQGAVPSRDCNASFTQLVGGNPDLQPEESKAYTLGFVFQPTPSISFGADYFRYSIRQGVRAVGASTLFADPATYAGRFVRCSQASQEWRAAIAACHNPGAVDPLAYVINVIQNVGSVETSGFDFQFDWKGAAHANGRLSLGIRGTYMSRYDYQLLTNGPFLSGIANYFPVIRLQSVANLGWEWRNWAANLFWRYQSGYVDQNLNIPRSSPFFNTVESYRTFDLSATWRGTKGLTVRFGVLNLFDMDPPFTNQLANFQSRGYDDNFHNPRGRTYRLGASYEFQ